MEMAEALKEIMDRLRILEEGQTRNNVHVEDMHHALMGNGQPGMIQDFHKMKGGLSVAKFIATSGAIGSIIALLKVFI
jgi:hypothetical protein